MAVRYGSAAKRAAARQRPFTCRRHESCRRNRPARTRNRQRHPCVTPGANKNAAGFPAALFRSLEATGRSAHPHRLEPLLLTLAVIATLTTRLVALPMA